MSAKSDDAHQGGSDHKHKHRKTKSAAATAAAGGAEAAASSNHDGHRRVLIGVDRSEHSERAVLFYAAHLKQERDLVIFVNVTEPPDVSVGFGALGSLAAEAYAKSIDQTLCEARQLASDVRALCDSLGVGRVKFLERIARGPGPAIVKIAREEGVDFIVMGTRGMGAIKRTFVGSVSDYVLHHARKPVVIVPPPPQTKTPPPVTSGEGAGAVGKST